MFELFGIKKSPDAKSPEAHPKKGITRRVFLRGSAALLSGAAIGALSGETQTPMAAAQGEAPARISFLTRLKNSFRGLFSRAESTAPAETPLDFVKIQQDIETHINNYGFAQVRSKELIEKSEMSPGVLIFYLENDEIVEVTFEEIETAYAQAIEHNEPAVISVLDLGSIRDKLIKRLAEQPPKADVPALPPPENLLNLNEVSDILELEERGLHIINLDPEVKLDINRSVFAEGGLLDFFDVTKNNRLVVILSPKIVGNEFETEMNKLDIFMRPDVPSDKPGGILEYLRIYQDKISRQLQKMIDHYKQISERDQGSGNTLAYLQTRLKLNQMYTLDELYERFRQVKESQNIDTPTQENSSEMITNQQSETEKSIDDYFPSPGAYAKHTAHTYTNEAGEQVVTNIVVVNSRGPDSRCRASLTIKPTGEIEMLNETESYVDPFNPIVGLKNLPEDPQVFNREGEKDRGLEAYLSYRNFNLNWYHEFFHAMKHINEEYDADEGAVDYLEKQYEEWIENADTKDLPFIFTIGNQVYYVDGSSNIA